MMQKIQIYIFLLLSLLSFIGGVIIGLIVLQFCESPVKEDVWFWFFSTIAQVYAAIFSLIIIAYFSHRSNLFTTNLPTYTNLTDNLIETTLNLTKTIKNISKKPQNQITETDKIEKRDAQTACAHDTNIYNICINDLLDELEHLRNETINYTTKIGFVLLISLIFLPLGQLNTNNEQILNILLKFNLTNNKLDFLLITGFLCFCISNTYMVLNELLMKRKTYPKTGNPLYHEPTKINTKHTKK